MRGGPFRHDGIFWRRFGAWGAVHLPDAVKVWLAPLVAWLFLLCVPAARRQIAANLEVVLGPCGRFTSLRRSARSMTEFAHLFVETFEVQSRGARGEDVGESLEIDLEGTPELAGPGPGSGGPGPASRGLIVLTSHFGCWEIGARALSRYGRPVNVVMASEANPTVRAFLEQMRVDTDLRVIFSDSSPFASVEMLQALRRGEIVAIQMDRIAPGQSTRDVRFFGRRVKLPIGAFALARAATVPIWPVFSVRTGRRRYRFLPEPPIEIPREAGDETLLLALQQLATRFEQRVQEFPHQWFQFGPFFEPPSPDEISPSQST